MADTIANNLSVTFKILWSLVIAKCGGQGPQIISVSLLFGQMLVILETLNPPLEICIEQVPAKEG